MRYKNKLLCILAILVNFSMVSNVNAIAGFAAIGGKASTLGLGAEVRVPIAQNFYGRFALLGFEYSDTYNSSNVDYKGTLKLFNAPLMLDYHPIDGSGIRVSAGVAYMDNKLTIKGTPNRIVTFNNVQYSPAEVGSITGTIKNKMNFAPIVTAGYDSSVMTMGIFTFDFEVGFMYASSIKVSASANGLLASDPRFQQDLLANVKDATDSTRKRFKLYPIFAFGVKFNF